jgi:anaerobic selenocysteine-containing dehydrogenase
MYQHTRTFRLPWTRSLSPEPHADINAADAAAAGIEDGAWMHIITPKSQVTVRAHVTAIVRERDVHLYHDWPQANANDLIEGDYLDPISGFPGYRSSLCRIEPADKANAPDTATSTAIPSPSQTRLGTR